MVRLHIVVEGQTEETFVNNVLRDHLVNFQVIVDARCVLTRHKKQNHKTYKGGISTYEKLRKDITLWAREDDNVDSWFTTMFDLYGLPNGFPGFAEAQRELDPYEKVRILEQGLKEDISYQRVEPYIQLYEFETLLFSDPSKIGLEFPNHVTGINNLVKLRAQFGSPELIDEGNETAPSKRIIEQIPEYAGRKVTSGPIIAESIGLKVLRSECPHFGQWLGVLEALG